MCLSPHFKSTKFWAQITDMYDQFLELPKYSHVYQYNVFVHECYIKIHQKV